MGKSVHETGAEALSREFFGAILDHVAYPIFVKDAQFRFVLVNRACCEMLGFTRLQLLGKTDYDFFPRAEADFFRLKDREVFETGARVEIDQESLTDAAGGVHVLATTKVPLRSDEGHVTHVVGIVHDITRLKRAEEALLKANEQLEQRVAERTALLRKAQDELVRTAKLAVLGQLAGGLAHQIRNPLGAIKNAAYLLRTALGEHADERVTSALAVIHEEIHAANQTITDLLDYARVRPSVPREQPIADVVRDALDQHAVPSNVDVSLALDRVPPVGIDSEQVVGAFVNLIRNALDAMPSGGTLSIHAVADGDDVFVTIDDTGEGVADSVRAHLFEPLLTTKATGLGLGLTTAKALIESQGGSIALREKEGPGARFEVRLPTAAFANAKWERR